MPSIKLIINLIISGINVFILSRYIYLLYHKRIKPSLAMWVFFSTAVGISLFSHLSYGDYTISDNILNFADFILVVAVSIAILIWGDQSTRFNKFDLFCLAAVGMIVLFWAVSQNHVITNIAVQSIMVISYIPVIKRMVSMKQNTEAFSVWIALMLAPILSLFVIKGLLAYLYTVRALICTATLLILMLRIEYLNKLKVKNQFQ